MRYHGSAVGRQHGGSGRAQPLSVVMPEPITELSDKAYDNDVDDDSGMGILPWRIIKSRTAREKAPRMRLMMRTQTRGGRARGRGQR